MMNIRFIIVFFVVLIQNASIFAQTDSVKVGVICRNHFTRESLPCIITIMDKDSIILSKDTAVYNSILEDYACWQLVPSCQEYILKAEYEDFETYFVAFSVPQKRKTHKLKDILMRQQQSILLDEVTVKASKVLMVNRGDTIIYNAAAFKLSHGSMLDALVKSLPGAEIDESGRISINGEFVSSLLVNGRDFFRGDPKIALDNLPAYYVDNIKVYHKMSDYKLWLYGDSAKLDKKKDPLVLDVNLKRQYEEGWIANAEVARGTNDTYFYRLFGMRYTKQSNLFMFGNFNNLNNSQTANKDGNWKSGSWAEGLHSYKIMGVNFNLTEKKTRAKFDTSLKYAETQSETEHIVSSENFYDTGNTYGKNHSLGQKKKKELMWKGSLSYPGNSIWVYFAPEVNYSYYDNHSTNLTAFFLTDCEESYMGEILDSLFAPTGSSRLTKKMINKRKQNTLGNFESYNISGNISARFKILPYKSLSLSLRTCFISDREKIFSKDIIELGESGEYYKNVQNRFTHLPSKSKELSARLSYPVLSSKHIDIDLDYSFEYKYSSGERNLYQLEKYYGEDYSLGLLPSTSDSLQSVIDLVNSYEATNRDIQHQTSLQINVNAGKYHLFFHSPILFRERKITDYRNMFQEKYKRKTTGFQPEMFLEWNSGIKTWELRLSYEKRPIPMSYLLNVRDDTDLLNVSTGNSDLKDGSEFRSFLAYKNQNRKLMRFFTIESNQVVFRNSISMSKAYNKKTGVSVFKPLNINGNWFVDLKINYSTPIDSTQRFIFSTNTKFVFQNSNDYITDISEDSDITQPTCNKVRNFTVGENIKLDCRLKNLTLSFKGALTYRHSESPLASFSTINAFDYNYGIAVIIPLVFGLDLESDITMWSHRGYHDKNMNINELLWNGAISYALGKQKQFIVKLSGHDMLNQVRSVRNQINSQGRVETWYKTLPSYVMLSATYRFNKKPKKKSPKMQELYEKD